MPMEYRRIYVDDHIRKKCSKQIQVANNVDLRGPKGHMKKSVERYSRTPSKPKRNKCKDIRITETYDEVLDLRNASILEIWKNDETKLKNASENVTTNGMQSYLHQVCEFPNMHNKIMHLCSAKASSRFTDEFNLKTAIISERIINKQLELQEVKTKPSVRINMLRLIPPEVGQRIVAKKILKKEKELHKNELAKQGLIDIVETSSSVSEMQVSELSSIQEMNDGDKTNNLQKANSVFHSSICLSDNVSIIGKEGQGEGSATLQMINNRVRRKNILQTRAELYRLSRNCPYRRRWRPSAFHESLERSSTTSTCTQTDIWNLTKNASVQTNINDTTNGMKMLTKLCEAYSLEDNHFPVVLAKHSDGACPRNDQSTTTQVYEHFTISDLVCLDWIDKNLFTVNLNPHNIILDEKIKEVSEMASKSSFFSDLNPLALPL